MSEILSPEKVAACKVIADQYHIHALQEMCESYETLRRYAEAEATEQQESEQILGKVLGYPWYKDDPNSFPDATEEDGVCIGDHTLVSIAMEASSAITKLRSERDEAQGYYVYDHDERDRLIKRLEAAEKVCEKYEKWRDGVCGSVVLNDAIKAWEEAKK